MSQFQTVLTGADFFSFTTRGGTTLELHGALISWTNRVGIRLANYEYLKRDGGEADPMGAAQARFGYRCCFIGPDVALLGRNVINTVRREPKGQVVDPRLGTIRAACEGVHCSESPESAIDYWEFTIDFVEDSVDTAISDDVDVGPSVRARQVVAASELARTAIDLIVSERIASSVYAALVAAGVEYSTLTDRFADAALAAADAGLPDLTLDTLLGRVADKRDEVVLALNATLPYTREPDVSLVGSRTAVYMAYAGCVQLLQAVQSRLPQLIEHTVATAEPLTTTLVRVYGKDARQMRQDFYRYNRIPTPYWIPAGTKLRLIAPKVRQ